MSFFANKAINGTTSGTTNGKASLDFTTFSNTINGKPSSTKQTRHGINPATREANAKVPISSISDVDAAVAAARTAFQDWSKRPVDERQNAVVAFADAIMSHKPEFAELLVREQGKPLQMAEGEVDGAVGMMKAITTINLPEEVVEDTEYRKVIVRYTPLGVVCGIVPWNFPLLLACLKIAPALITGNTIIIKPSPFTPYCGLKAVELGQKFFPPGVLQALSGDDNLGPLLTEHEDIDKISFTGSSFTGKKVMASAAKTLKRVTLELGGNDPAVICKDVDIQAIAPKIANLAFGNSGQVCLALKRIFIHESIYPAMRDAIVAYTRTMKVGEGNESAVTLGPVQNAMQYERVKGFFADIDTQKQKIAIGGSVDENAKGYFITPTIIDKPDDESRIVTEEPFGPIVPLLSWSSEAEVISRANNTKMGLGASVWSRDLHEAERIGRQLEAGSVWINAHLEPSPHATMGGHKWSGIGSELGKQGMISYCNSQALFLKKGE